MRKMMRPRGFLVCYLIINNNNNNNNNNNHHLLIKGPPPGSRRREKGERRRTCLGVAILGLIFLTTAILACYFLFFKVIIIIAIVTNGDSPSLATGWQKLASFRQAQKMPSILSSDAYLLIRDKKRCFFAYYQNCNKKVVFT